MRTYVHEYGIGPWDVYEFSPDPVRGMHERGEPVSRAWRLALAHVGQVQWELVVAEIFSGSPGVEQEPDASYPPRLTTEVSSVGARRVRP